MNDTKRPQLLWIRREPTPKADDGLEIAADLAEPSPFRDLIEEIGIPTFDPATPIEDLRGLLETAVEVEHALMVQYLYALYSVRSMPELEPVQESLQTIAVQEMGHLMTVENLVLLVGGRPYISRQDLSPQADKDPIPFRLEPLTRHSLAKYVAAESPLLGEGDPGFEELAKIVEEARIASMSDIHRVGLIYAAIYWLFQKGDGVEGPWTNLPRQGFRPGWHVGDADLQSAGAILSRQADLSEWGASVPDFFVNSTETREKALDAILKIAAQGEGLENMEGSHFDKFRTVYREFDSLPQPVAIDVPVDPTVGTAPESSEEGEHNRISNPRTRKWANLFDGRYRILLLCLRQTFFYDKADAAQRTIRMTLRNWAMQEMRRGLRPIALELVTQPRFEGDIPKSATVFAAPTFGLDEDAVSDPETLLGYWKRHKALNEGSLRQIDELLALTDLSPSEKIVLNGLKTNSTARAATIEAQIAANGG